MHRKWSELVSSTIVAPKYYANSILVLAFVLELGAFLLDKVISLPNVSRAQALFGVASRGQIMKCLWC